MIHGFLLGISPILSDSEASVWKINSFDGNSESTLVLSKSSYQIPEINYYFFC